MVVNILIVTFVAAYCAIVLLGHILLLTAIWRGRPPKGSSPQDATATAANTLRGPVPAPPRLAA